MRGLTILLVLTLLFSVLTPTTGASPETGYYRDWAVIRQKSAVAMLTDLGLVTGYDDGTFQPDRPVTRAEAAKLIAGLLTEDIPDGVLCRYPDTVGNWAAGYIEFCAEEQIISGPAGTDFRPGEAVTVRELAKMLLAVLGWDVSACTGPDWAGAVDAAAMEAGLYNGDEEDKSRPASREETCLLFNNALQSSVVQGYTETGEPVYELDEMLQPKTLLEIRFEAVPVSGVVQANSAADLRTEREKLGENSIHISGYVKDFQVSARIAQDKVLVGHRVDLYARLGSDGNKVLGIPVFSPAEISHTMAGRELLSAIMDVEGLTVDEDTEYYLDYVPSDTLCLENLDESKLVTIIDHEGDRVIDLVLVNHKAEDSDE